MGIVEKTVGQSAKHTVIAAVCVVVLLSDSLVPVYYVVAAMVNAVFSKILKRVIREPRPLNSPKKGHGMPSSHSQSIYYFATVLCCKGVCYLVSSPAIPFTHFCAVLTGIVVILYYSYYAW
jgi:dolichyldiphosphatase